MSRQISSFDAEEPKQRLKTDYFFVAPPEYFSLAQKKTYFDHYKNEFGERIGLKEYHKKTKRGDDINIEDLTLMKTRPHREEVLTEDEKTLSYHGKITAKPSEHNVSVLYFSNKYIEEAIFKNAFDLAKRFPEAKSKQRKALWEELKLSIEKYLYKGKDSLTHLLDRERAVEGFKRKEIDHAATVEMQTVEVKASLTEQKAIAEAYANQAVIMEAEMNMDHTISEKTKRERFKQVHHDLTSRPLKDELKSPSARKKLIFSKATTSMSKDEIIKNRVEEINKDAMLKQLFNIDKNFFSKHPEALLYQHYVIEQTKNLRTELQELKKAFNKNDIQYVLMKFKKIMQKYGQPEDINEKGYYLPSVDKYLNTSSVDVRNKVKNDRMMYLSTSEQYNSAHKEIDGIKRFFKKHLQNAHEKKVLKKNKRN